MSKTLIVGLIVGGIVVVGAVYFIGRRAEAARALRDLANTVAGSAPDASDEGSGEGTITPITGVQRIIAPPLQIVPMTEMIAHAGAAE